jgi:hypothetical protein
MENLFSAPIPGQSLTQAPGAAKWEYPPKFVDVSEALEFTWNKFTSKDGASAILLPLKKGMPVEYLVNTILFQGIADNMWTLDVALLMKKVVAQQIAAIGHLKGIKMKISNPNPKKDIFISGFLDLLEKEKTEAIPETAGKASLFSGMM